MKAISQHFYRHDFACPCGCGFADISKELVSLLERVYQYFERPVYVQLGCCCTYYNKAHGGEYATQHLLGAAADILVNTIAPDAVADYLENAYPKEYGIGRGESYTHIDVRPLPKRWRE
ncbi:D-Ala-D-Ala carboxypeptidase family metallohydrolase [Buttiauxella agrestis]|uniref:D-Ala-D-Ala carboxypeptidase family metallohydrolase n=1 Tax=Buttiauxella agrestis TaxID=82977 RepID=UPI000E205099|nr:D-Ala-D-Ala carboxypeptidase family metallohydrolase [Buttiauxella agrestis]